MACWFGNEVSEAAQFNPPDYLRPQFTSDAGALDLAGYQSFLYSLPPEQLLVLEAYYRDVIPRGKLLRQVASGIFVSDSELWQQYKDQTEQVEIRYVPMDPNYPADRIAAILEDSDPRALITQRELRERRVERHVAAG